MREAVAGGARAESVSTKVANALSASTRLQKVYTPVLVATARQVDEAREDQGKKGEKCVTAPAG